MKNFWVWGWWFETLEEAKLVADKIGRPVKAAKDYTPTDEVVYDPTAASGNGTFHYEGTVAV